MFLKNVLSRINKEYKNSAFYALLLKLGTLYKESFFYALWSKEPAQTETPFFYMLSGNAALALKRRGKALCLNFAEFNRGSLNDVFFTKLVKKEWFHFEYICAAFFFLMIVTPHNVWNNFIAVAGTAILGIIFLFRSVLKNDLEIKCQTSPWLIIFILSVFGGIFISPDRADGLRVALFMISAIIFMGFVSSIENEAVLIKFIKILVAALFLICVYGIYQRVMGVEAQKLLTDLENNKGMPGRVYSTFENPNNFAEAIVLLLPFVFAMFILSKRNIAKAGYACVFAVCLAALMFTYSRSCYVSFAISAVVFLLLYKPKLLLPFIVIAIALIPFLPESVTSRILTIASTADTSNAYRIYLWGGAWKMLKEYIFRGGAGVGSAAFIKAYAPFANPLAANAPHSHMLYMELFIELGAVGGIGFFVFWLSSLKKGLSVLKTDNKKIKCLTAASISAFAGISFAAAAEYIWFYPRVMYVFFIVLGILLCSVKLNKKAG